MKWNDIYLKFGSVQIRPLKIIVDFNKMLPKNKKLNILDLGCGTGRHTKYFGKNKNFEMFAFDSSEKALEILKKEYVGTNLNIIKGFFDKLPFKNNFFDVIISTKTLHHGSLVEIQKFISEITRVLKPRGFLLIVILSDKDFRVKTGEKYKGEINTRINCDNLPDADIPHHFFSNEEINTCFSDYVVVEKRDINRVAMNGLKKSSYYDLILKKTKK